MRFKLIAGTSNIFGETYKRGDIIDTPVDLTKMFRNAFVQVHSDPTPALRTLPVKAEASEPVQPPVKATPSSLATPATSQADEDPAEKDPVSTPKPRGRDVTKSFPKALEEDYSVFQVNKLYFVYDNDDFSKSVNDKGISKSKVDECIVNALDR